MDILTRQENRIAKLIAEEMSEKMIAAELFISPKTVTVHKKNIRKKLGVKSSVGIAIRYLQSLEHPQKFVLAGMFLILQISMICTDPEIDLRRSKTGSRTVKVRRYVS